MEIVKISDNSIKIKTKNVSIAVDPVTKTDSDIIIVTNESVSLVVPDDIKLLIEGPGEYEVGGVHIKGEKAGADFMYTIFDDAYRLYLLPMELISKVREDDDMDAIVIKATGEISKKDVSTLSSSVIVYGVKGNMQEDENVKRLSRVNLKKKEEIKGFIVYLG